MPTPNIIVRTPGELREQIEAKAEQEGRSLSDVIRSAIRQYVTGGGDSDEALQRALRRAHVLEVKLDRARAELAALKAQGSADAAAGGDEAFIAALEGAAPDAPVSAAELAAVSGWHEQWVRHLLTPLVTLGYITRVGTNLYAYVPGAGLREGLRAARDYNKPETAEERLRLEREADQLRVMYEEEGASIEEIAARLDVPMQTVHARLVAAGIPRRRSGPPAGEPCGQAIREGGACGRPAGHTGTHRSEEALRRRNARIAPGKREAADGQSPAPAPPVPSGAAMDAPHAIPAPRSDELARVKERAAAVGAPLVPASALPSPGDATAVFQQPGAERVVTAPVPEVPDHSGKAALDDTAQQGRPRGRARHKCPHRLPAGAWCKTCQQPK